MCNCKVHLRSTEASVLYAGIARRLSNRVLLQAVAALLVASECTRPSVPRYNMCHQIVEAVSVEICTDDLRRQGQRVA